MPYRALTTWWLLAGGVASGLLAACDSGGGATSAADARLDTVPVCLTSVQTENGAPCEAPDGYFCPVDFSCSDADPPLVQQADCVCSGGEWRCAYAATVLDGAVIVPGATPVCISGNYGDAAACPASEVEAARGGPDGGPLGCLVESAGITCLYDSGVTCLDAAFPNIDTCQCVAGANAGLVFSCESVACDVAPPDAAPPDAAADGLLADADAARDSALAVAEGGDGE